MAEKACVFIDGANWYYQCKESLGRTDVDLGALASWLVGPARTLVRTYYYTVRLTPEHAQDQRDAQERFLGALHRVAYLEVRLGKLVKRDVKCENCGDFRQRWVEKGVDMRVGVDMLAGAAKKLYDTAILVSGDGDLAEAIKAVKELGKHVEVASFPRGRAYELIQVADVSRDLTVGDVTPFLLRP